jgi:hypothetical protein
MTAPVSFDAALAAVRSVGDGPRLLEQANRIADRVEAENTELRRRIDTAREYVAALMCDCDRIYVYVPDVTRLHQDRPPTLVRRCERCQALDILGGAL